MPSPLNTSAHSLINLPALELVPLLGSFLLKRRLPPRLLTRTRHRHAPVPHQHIREESGFFICLIQGGEVGVRRRGEQLGEAGGQEREVCRGEVI